ncbi:MAG: hypothetical protein ACYTDY_11025 [Planctomycetota bacterium]|jgi:hypothetical protein
MSDDDRIETWKRARASEPAPDGFADRVMERLADPARRRRIGLTPVLLCATAGVAGLARVAAVLALFLTE